MRQSERGRDKREGERDGASERERESVGREKDNFLALLLNKSVSIATIQPAAGERGGGVSGGERQREWREGKKKGERERYHSNGGSGRKRTWRKFKKA